MGIRLAQTVDRAVLEEIVQTAYEPWEAVIGARPVPMMADYGRIIADEQAYVLENGKIDALIVLVPEESVLVIENVAVRPDRQGRGLGRRMMAFAEFRARSLGLGAVRLYTNEKMTANIGLYESLGYRETSRDEKDGRQVVHMRKDL
jgi:ribosomal protein S18 acetylase RimI-like enzyme